MNRSELIEAMARALYRLKPNCRGNRFETHPSRDEAMQEAKVTLSTLETAIPGLADLLDGKAVVMPRQLTEPVFGAMIEEYSAGGTWDTIYADALAVSPYGGKHA